MLVNIINFEDNQNVSNNFETEFYSISNLNGKV